MFAILAASSTCIHCTCTCIRPHVSINTYFSNFKVTDFGLSVVKSGVGIENLLMDFCGTPMYMGKIRIRQFSR